MSPPWLNKVHLLTTFFLNPPAKNPLCVYRNYLLDSVFATLSFVVGIDIAPLSKVLYHTYIRTYVHTYIRTCVHTYIRTYAQTYCVHTDIRTYGHPDIRTYVHTYIRTYINFILARI